MRRGLVSVTCIWRCAAADASAAASSAAPAGEESAAKTLPAWRPFRMAPWQVRRLAAAQQRAGDSAPAMLSTPYAKARPTSSGSAESAPDAFVLEGGVGPHPVVVFPPLARDVKGTSAALERFRPMLAAMAHSHGAVCVPYTLAPETADAEGSVRAARKAAAAKREEALKALPAGDVLSRVPHPHAAADYDADGLIAAHCHSIAAVAHALGLRWFHAVGYSYGGLVAAKMAMLYPRLVGSLVLIDTPLVGANDRETHDLRNEIYLGRTDANTPRDQLEAAVKRCGEISTGPKAASLSVPCSDDKAIYGALFDPAETFSADATSRDLGAFASLDHLRALRHPALAVYPHKQEMAKAASSAAEVKALSSTLAIRRALHVKAAASHDALFEPAAAKEIGAGLKQWAARFDLDTFAQRKYEQARDRLTKKKEEPKKAAEGDDAAADGGKKGGKKKGKKDKKAAKQ